MKKQIAALLAAVLLLTTATPALAASSGDNDKLYQIASISYRPVYSNGTQFDPADTIAPDQTVYYPLPKSLAAWVDNSKNVRISVKKNQNSKLIQSVKVVDKKLSSTSKDILIPNVAKPDMTFKTVGHFAKYNAKNRNTYLAVELNDTTSSEEFKVDFTVTFSAKKPASLYYGDRNAAAGDAAKFFEAKASGDRLQLRGVLYVGNAQEEGDDATVTVGSKGLTVKPVKNGYNEVVFESDDTYATLSFLANSNPDSFYAKLSTKWTSALSSKFKNTDAVIRKFTPATVDCVSRAYLSLNNPFDPDEVDPEDVYVYTADSNGRLKNITNTVTYDEDADAYVIRTRTLTTYIISDRKVKI